MNDVTIIGAGPAGLSAALILGRACRSFIVVDSGPARNFPSPEAHSFLSRDGIEPGELLRIGREQLAPYATAEWREGLAVEAAKTRSGFSVTLADGRELESRKLLLTTGVIDQLPDVDGVHALWGKSVFHCPYCHGWEMRDRPLGVYGRDEAAAEFALMLLGWTSDVILFTDGAPEFGKRERAKIERAKIRIEERKVAHFEGTRGMLERVVLSDTTVIPRSGILLKPKQVQRSGLATLVGCSLDEKGHVITDEKGETTVSGVYAAGDSAQRKQLVVFAAADGATAAMAIVSALLEENLVGE